MGKEDGTLAGSGLGIVPWETEDEEPEEARSEDEAQAEAATPEQDDTAAEPSQPGEAEEVPEPDSVPEGEATEAQDRLYAGKFQTVEAIEDGYRNAEARLTQATQEAAETRRNFEALQAQFQQNQQLLETLAPAIIQQQLEANPGLAEELQAALRQQQAAEQAQVPLRQQIEAMQQERAQEQEDYAKALVIARWRQEHPDVAPNSPADYALAQAAQALDLDISVVESLDLALDASRDPALMTVLRANPHWIEQEGGVEYAKAQARLISQGTPSPAPVQANQATTTTATSAYVETGGQGAPTSGAPGGGKDEFDEAVAAYNQEKRSPLLR